MEKDKQWNEIARTLLDTARVKVKILNSANGKVKANAVVDFGILIIKGFMIMGEDGGEYVNPPAYRRPPPAKWGKIFWSEYPGFWTELSQKILEAYRMEKEPGKSLEEIADSIEF